MLDTLSGLLAVLLALSVAVLAGVATAFLGESLLPVPLQDHRHLLLGLLASGGSGFWTSVLGYVGTVKDIKKT